MHIQIQFSDLHFRRRRPLKIPTTDSYNAHSGMLPKLESASTIDVPKALLWNIKLFSSTANPSAPHFLHHSMDRQLNKHTDS